MKVDALKKSMRVDKRKMATAAPRTTPRPVLGASRTIVTGSMDKYEGFRAPSTVCACGHEVDLGTMRIDADKWETPA
jgi:hypothetical protein